MSERARVTALLALGLLVPLALQAQTPTAQARVREAEARQARAQARFDVANDSLQAERRGLLSSSPSRELTIGEVVVRVPVFVTAREGAAAAAELGPVVAGFYAPVLPSDRRLSVWWDTAAGRDQGTLTVMTATDTIPVQAGGVDAGARVVIGVEGGLGYRLTRALDPGVIGWLGGVPTNAVAPDAEELRLVRRALALNHSTVAHECLRGEASSCGAIFDLAGPASPLDRWYRPADLPGIAKSSEGLREHSTAWQRCAWADDPAICHDLIGALPPTDILAPVAGFTRGSLMRFALALGTTEAIPRLIAARGRPVADQLGAAAGSSGSELLAAWTRTLSAGDAQRDPAAFVLAAVWVLVLLGVAAGLLTRRAV